MANERQDVLFHHLLERKTNELMQKLVNKVKKRDKYRRAKGLFLVVAKEWGMRRAINKVRAALVSEMLKIWDGVEPNEKIRELPSKKNAGDAARAYRTWGTLPWDSEKSWKNSNWGDVPIMLGEEI